MKRLLCVMVCAILLTGCGKGEVAETVVEIDEMAVESSETRAESNETTVSEEITGDIYNPIIAGLSEEDAYAIIENDAKYPILLVSPGVYDDGMGNWAALESDVYYVIDGEVKNIGTVMSGGTAYPISYNQAGFYAANGHYVEYYEISEEHGMLVSKEMYLEMFDENGTATYMKVIDGVESESTEEELAAVFEEFSNATVVNYNRLTEQLKTVNTGDEAERKTLSDRVVIIGTASDGSRSVYEYDKAGNLITHILNDENGTLLSWAEYEYDSLGNETKCVGYYEDGSIMFWEESEYDSLGKETKWINCNEDGSIQFWVEYEYDSMGNKVKHLVCETDGSATVRYEYKYEYDSQGNVMKCTTYSEGRLWQEEEYDSMGNGTKCIEYDVDGDIEFWSEYKYDLQGNITKHIWQDVYDEKYGGTYEYEYDGMGNRTKRIIYNEDGSIQFWEEYEYNSMGNETKKITYNADGSIECCEAYEYEYDTLGNLKKRIHSKDGSIDSWIEYTYDFRGITPQRLVYIGQNLADYSIQALE